MYIVHQRHLRCSPQRGVRPQHQVVAGARGRLISRNLRVQGSPFSASVCPPSRLCTNTVLNQHVMCPDVEVVASVLLSMMVFGPCICA